MAKKSTNWRNELATAKQLYALNQLSIQIPRGCTKGQAWDLLQEYTKTREMLREKAFTWHPKKCALCGRQAEADLVVHHRHYRTLGKENPEDVVILCDGCHDHVHEVSRTGNIPPAFIRFVDPEWKDGILDTAV